MHPNAYIERNSKEIREALDMLSKILKVEDVLDFAEKLEKVKEPLEKIEKLQELGGVLSKYFGGRGNKLVIGYRYSEKGLEPIPIFFFKPSRTPEGKKVEEFLDRLHRKARIWILTRKIGKNKIFQIMPSWMVPERVEIPTGKKIKRKIRTKRIIAVGLFIKRIRVNFPLSTYKDKLMPIIFLLHQALVALGDKAGGDVFFQSEQRRRMIWSQFLKFLKFCLIETKEEKIIKKMSKFLLEALSLLSKVKSESREEERIKSLLIPITQRFYTILPREIDKIALSPDKYIKIFEALSLIFDHYFLKKEEIPLHLVQDKVRELRDIKDIDADLQRYLLELSSFLLRSL